MVNLKTQTTGNTQEHFEVQMDNDPKHTVCVTQELLEAKKVFS